MVPAPADGREPPWVRVLAGVGASGAGCVAPIVIPES